jgi:hypothetical protein
MKNVYKNVTSKTNKRFNTKTKQNKTKTSFSKYSYCTNSRTATIPK